MLAVANCMNRMAKKTSYQSSQTASGHAFSAACALLVPLNLITNIWPSEWWCSTSPEEAIRSKSGRRFPCVTPPLEIKDLVSGCFMSAGGLQLQPFMSYQAFIFLLGRKIQKDFPL